MSSSRGNPWPRSPELQADVLPSKPPGKSKDMGAGSIWILQGTFPTKGPNQGLLHYKHILYKLNYQGSLIPLQYTPIIVDIFHWLFKNCIYFNLLFGFCQTLTWISHGCRCVPHPEPPSHLPPHPIPQGHPIAPALSTQSHASNLDWRSVSHMIIYKFQCYPVKSSHPRHLPQSPKDCSVHVSLLLSCIKGYRYHLSKFHIYALVHYIGVILSFIDFQTLLCFLALSDTLGLSGTFSTPRQESAISPRSSGSFNWTSVCCKSRS